MKLLTTMLSLVIEALSFTVVRFGALLTTLTTPTTPRLTTADNTHPLLSLADNTRDNTHLQVNYDENYRWN